MYVYALTTVGICFDISIVWSWIIGNVEKNLVQNERFVNRITMWLDHVIKIFGYEQIFSSARNIPVSRILLSRANNYYITEKMYSKLFYIMIFCYLIFLMIVKLLEVSSVLI